MQGSWDAGSQMLWPWQPLAGHTPSGGLGLNGLITQLLAALPFTTDSLTVLGGGRMRVSPVPRGGWEWTWDQVFVPETWAWPPEEFPEGSPREVVPVCTLEMQGLSSIPMPGAPCSRGTGWGLCLDQEKAEPPTPAQL